MMQRREFVLGTAGLGAAGLLGAPARPAAADPPPETTKLRLAWTEPICAAPQYVAADLLKIEGFGEIEYVRGADGQGLTIAQLVGTGRADMVMTFVGPLLKRIDEGDPIVLLAGGHVGCFEVVTTEKVHAIRDLRGKRVALPDADTGGAFFAAVAAFVGLGPIKEVNVLIVQQAEAKQLLADGKIDALLAFPPWTQRMRAERIGRVILDSALDRPWSQYFLLSPGRKQEFCQEPPGGDEARDASHRQGDRCVRRRARACRARSRRYGQGIPLRRRAAAHARSAVCQVARLRS